MPRQNRVTPFGEIVAIPERGTMMGNRGRLHDAEGYIRRPWQVRRWLICVLEFRGRHREVMAPDRYTALFFLDESTGLAAGHRPCFEMPPGPVPGLPKRLGGCGPPGPGTSANQGGGDRRPPPCRAGGSGAYEVDLHGELR